MIRKKINYGVFFWLLVVALSVLFSLSLVMLDKHTKHVQKNALLSSAQQTAQAFRGFRLFYSENVVARLKKHSNIKITHDYKLHSSSVPLPATLSLELAEKLNNTSRDTKVNLTSDFPFPWRNVRKLSQFESESLKSFRAKGANFATDFVKTEQGSLFQYSTPVRMKPSCIACHNARSDSPKRDWKVGDVRGIQTVAIHATPAGIFASFQTTQIIIVLLIFGATSILVLFRLQAENRRHVEQLTAEKKLSEEQAVRLKTLIDESVDGIISVDANGVIEKINPSANRMFGYENRELIGMNVARLMSDARGKTLRKDISGFLKTHNSSVVGKTTHAEGLRKDGTQFPLDIAISDFKVAGRQMFTGFVRDATRRRETERNERRLKNQFKDAVTSALDGIIIIDENSVVMEFNPAAERIFGYERDTVIGENLVELIVPEKHRQAHIAGMKKFLETGEGPVLNNRIEIEAVRSDGAEILIELAIKESQGPTGKMFFGYLRDITERSAAERDLIEARDRAEVASRAKASFLAMMSHEIRTPLNGVLGILGLLHHENLNSAQRQLISTARKSGKSLLNIINDILDFSKLEAGKFELETGAFEADKLLKGVWELLRIQAEEKSIELICDLDVGLPEVLVGDQDRLRQIILNLAWNAIKFTKEGSVKIRASRVLSTEPGVRFEIIDTGIGIPKSRQSELFAEFATLDASYSRRFGGTGLGLAISKSLVEAMDGRIGMESEPGQGSNFWFEVPLQAGTLADLENEDADEEDTIPDFGGVRVLLAEDNATNQLVVSNLLEKFGCVVDAVSNGNEAVQSNSTHDYDLILMDISMPELDGIQATQRIRRSKSRNFDTPIIALTAYALDEDRARTKQVGMNGFVSKPISRNALVRAMKECLEDEDVQVEEIFETARQIAMDVTFDDDVLFSIMDDADEDFCTVVVQQFLADVARQLGKMLKAMDQGDAKSFEAASHALKGVAGTFGATDLHHIATRANVACRSGKVTTAFSLMEELESIARLSMDALPPRLRELDLAPTQKEAS